MPVELPYTHQIATGEQSREADRRTIEQFGVDGFTLMETAGIQAARFMATKTGHNSKGIYICGKGNNAGDALVAARYLSIQYGHTCHIFFPAGTEKLSADTKRNLDLLRKLQTARASVHIHTGIPEQTEVSEINSKLPEQTNETEAADYIVDGLFGTGLSSNVRAPLDTAIDWINRQNLSVYSMDIPSGLNSDTGKIMGTAVEADYTLSFGSLKLGFYLHSGFTHTGHIEPVFLSFPSFYRPSTAALISPGLDRILPPVRRREKHKYSDRVLYLVCGSEGLTGAAVMAAVSGWKTGVGAAILVTPRGLLPVYEHLLPGVIKSAVGDHTETFFTEKHSHNVLEILNQKKGVLLIGPGLGARMETRRFVTSILENFHEPAVIDADALRAVDELSPPDDIPWILTPHPGEARFLRGKPFNDDLDRIRWTSSYASSRSLHLVSKGQPVFVGTPEGRNFLTGYDTRMFSRAGFGDVLSGKIAGNLAITGEADLSILRAMLDGYYKAEKIIHQSPEHPLEPNDLL